MSVLGAKALSFIDAEGGGAFTLDTVGGNGEEAFIFEELEVKAGEQGVGVFKVGGLFMVGLIEEIERGSGLACHLRGEDGACERAGELKGF